MGRKRILDWDKIKELIQNTDYTDQKIANEVNCSIASIRKIRRNILGIKKEKIKKEWRMVNWMKWGERPVAASLSIRLSELKEIGMPVNGRIYYRIIPAGEKFIMEFKIE